MRDLTPGDLIKTFNDVLSQLDATRKEMAQADSAVVEKRAKYKHAYAKTYLGLDGSVENRRQTTDLITHNLRVELDQAEAVLRAHQEAIRMLRDRLEVGRSLSSILKMEWQQ